MAYFILYAGKLFRMDQEFVAVKGFKPDPRCAADDFAILQAMQNHVATLTRISRVPDSIMGKIDPDTDANRAISTQHLVNLLRIAGKHDAAAKLAGLISGFLEINQPAATNLQCHVLMALSRDEFRDVS